MKKIIFLLTITGLLAACSQPGAAHDEQVRISAASSLVDAMKAAEAEFLEIHPEYELIFNYGSSGKLRSQIEQGAPVDLFLSASEQDMEKLQAASLVSEGTVIPFAGNRLVLASASGAAHDDITGLLSAESGTVAVGEPESVPLGSYTKQALTDLGLWEQLEGKTIYAKDARQVLTYIESGNADLGIVYASDTSVSEEIEVLGELPENTVSIIYPGGIVGDAENQEGAQAFLAFLAGSEGQAILKEFGFSVPDGEMP